MKFEKKFLTNLFRCYATSSTVVNGEKVILLATEGEGACYSYTGKDLTKYSLGWTRWNNVNDTCTREKW